MITKSELNSLMNNAEEELSEAGIDDARVEVELILEYLLKIGRLEVYLKGPELINDNIIAEFQKIIKKRTTRYPLQYILGEMEFYGRRFVVNPSVMVPTPETELLCELAVSYVRNENLDQARILDVGVGAGVISVTVAAELPKIEITALDISSDALKLAELNAQEHGVDGRIQFIQSDRFRNLKPKSKFDLILSNPPYITEEDYKDVPPEVLADPKISLVAGPDGMDMIRFLIDNSPPYLKNGGRLIFEIGHDQSNQVMTYTNNDARYKSINIIKDLNDISRVVILSV
jgi:release factor glutamine methyltransferase